MAGYNKVIMMGNLTKDPEVKQVGAQSVCKLTIASNKQYKNKQTGAIAQEVCFIDVDVWGAQADSCKLYLQKGRPVLVEGRLKLDSWKDQEGKSYSRYSIVSERVVFLGFGDQQSDDISASDDQGMSSSLNSSIAPAKDGFKKGSFSQEKSKKSSSAFKDTLPFEEDLPF